MTEVITKAARLDHNFRLAGNIIASLLVVLVLAVSLPRVSWLPTFEIADEFLKPLALVMLATAALLTQSFTVRFGKRWWLGAAIDLTILAAIYFFAFTYLHEMAVEKPALFPESLLPDADPMMRTINGQPAWVAISGVLAAISLIVMTWVIWGRPIALVAIVAAGYTVLCALSSFYGWFPGNVFLNYQFGATAPVEELRKFLVVGDSHSLLGQFIGILLRIVLPFLILGGLFSATGGGRSLIKLAFQLTCHTRGGPAHAAVVSSSIFGTISGGPVINVLSTGVMTIPMMQKRGYSGLFAGAVESAASTGGQLMPPVMGVAAFFLANYTGVPYSSVVLAAIIPAILYYFCLFMSVSVEARKLGIEPLGRMPDELRMTRQDYLNLLIVFVPIGIIVAVLISGAFTVTAAGVFAVLALIPMTFIDPEVRAKPSSLITAFLGASESVSRILLIFIAVALVDSALSAIGFPIAFGALLSESTRGGISIFGYAITGGYYIVAILFLTMLVALLLGMGMPTLPAYANVAIVMGASLTGLGLSLFTANMFVFYFAVASSITPPVAVAAFAAASITKKDPMMTAVHAVRVGLSIFLIPFVFVFYPELLLIPAAFTVDAGASSGFIAMRPTGFEMDTFLWIMPRVLLAIYLIVTALSGFDGAKLSRNEIVLRLVLTFAIVMVPIWINLPATVLGILLLIVHHLKARRMPTVA